MSEILRLGASGIVSVTWHDVAKSNGSLTGYASVFNVVDDQDDVVLPGAFKRTINAWKQSGRKLPMHDGHDPNNDAVIGSFEDLKEDTFGLSVRASFSSTQHAQDIRTKAKEGHISGLSIFGDVIRKSVVRIGGKDRRGLDEVRLLHIALTSMPANFFAATSLVKSQWDAPTIPSDATPAMLRGLHAVYFPGMSPTVKSSYDLLHHTLAEDGTIGPANAQAVQAALAKLSGMNLDTDVKEAAQQHLQAHLDELTKSIHLDDQWVSDMRSALTIVNSEAQKSAVATLIEAYNAARTLNHEKHAPSRDVVHDDSSDYALALIGETGPNNSSPGSDSDNPLADLMASHEATQVASALADMDQIERELRGS